MARGFPISDKEADTIVCVLINNYLPIHMCPYIILSNNGTEFKNQSVDNVLQQLGIDCIFSTPYHLQSNRKLEVFHKCLQLTCKKLWENYPDNWDKYINQVLASYHVTPHWATTETSFFVVYRRDLNPPLHQLLEPMQQFLGNPESLCLNIESHCLALVIDKKSLDENRFKHAQKTTDHTHLI